MSKLDQMVKGYMDGMDWSSFYEPASLEHKPPAYKHGFRNGMDDRKGQPRDTANVLRRRAEMIIGS